MIEKAGGRRAEFGRGVKPSLFLSLVPLVADPLRRPPAFSIIPTDGEPGTGYKLGDNTNTDENLRTMLAF